LYFDFSSSRQIVNLTAARNSWNPYGTDFLEDVSSRLESLEYRNYRNGFKVTDFSTLDIGLGTALTFYYANATGLSALFWAQVGILPLIGKEMKTVRYVRDMAAVMALRPARSVPMKASDLASWSRGDQLSYTSKGGIVFFAGVGAPLPSVS